MQPKPVDNQNLLFSARLDRILDHNHPLFKLANVIDWSEFEQAFGKLYDPGQGRPAKPIRLMVGLHYLKHVYDLSDQDVVARWIENPYWQYFCGCSHFEHELPIDPSLMTKWRKKVKAEGMEKLLEVTIKTGLKTRVLKRTEFKRLSVDTTVQEKAISFPTDARLYQRMREKLVSGAVDCGIGLRQSYVRKGKQALVMHGRYAHARQYKRARKQLRKLKTYLGRVTRDIERKIACRPKVAKEFKKLLALSNRLLAQQRHDKNKLYSIHAPEVACISKGKSHKRYEFGCKVGVVTTMKNPFIVGIQAFEGNPFDGHTLSSSIEQAERLGSFKAQEIYVDRGYRGHDYNGGGIVHIVRLGWRKLPRRLRRWLKRRSVVEAVIGHSKNECRLARNYLLGVEGDKINAILCGCGYNIRRLLRAFLFWLYKFLLVNPFYCSPKLATIAQNHF
jgi:IS5 family transposase